jgi:hypothetical protein
LWILCGLAFAKLLSSNNSFFDIQHRSTMKSTPAQSAHFKFDLISNGKYTAAGSFTAAEGAWTDEGEASQVFWYTNKGDLQGILTLASQKGAVTFTFTATRTTEEVWNGHLVIINGNRAYENIHGQGETQFSLVFSSRTDGVNPSPEVVKGSFIGQVQYCPPQRVGKYLGPLASRNIYLRKGEKF